MLPAVTLTLALPKTGLYGAATGALQLADLGIPAVAWHRAGIDYRSPFGSSFAVPLVRLVVPSG